MTKIKKNGAKSPRLARLQQNTKQVLTQQAQDHNFIKDPSTVQKEIEALLKSEEPVANNGHAIALKETQATEQEKPRRIYASSITNTLTNAGIFNATASNCGTKYVSSNPMYTLANLQAMRADAYELITEVDAAETGYKYTVAQRMQEFNGLAALCALVIAELEISGASTETVDQVRTLVRKLRGQRKVPKNPDDPTANYASVSQMNYDNLVANLERLIMMVSADPNYDPAAEPLKIASLETMLGTLNTANNNVIIALAELNAKRMARNEFFNAAGTGLVEVFITAKKVILTNFGRQSEQFKRVSALGFRKIPVY